jgi:cell division septal protein FtsQ
MSEIYISQNIKKKNEILKKIKIFLNILILGAIIILICYLIIYSPVFSIEKINITNNERANNDEVLNFVKSNIFSNSIFKRILSLQNILIWPDYLKNNSNLWPEIKEVSIKKDYFHKNIEIKVLERKLYGMWCKEKECLWFDDLGYLFNKTPLSEGALILKVFDYSGRKLGIGNFVLPQNLMSNLTQVFETLQKAQINFYSAELKNLENEEIAIKTQNGPIIYFSLHFPPPDISLIKKKIEEKRDFNSLEYLDLRIENKVFYK